MTKAVLVMGVSGCGKTTIAQAIAGRLGATFLEGDLLHPPENIEAMRLGQPLDDAMRAPWLDAIASAAAAKEGVVVIACSALKRRYRDRLRQSLGPMPIVHLSGEHDLLFERMTQRRGHFMPPGMLESQLADLEPPGAEEDAVTLDVAHAPDALVEAAVAYLRGALEE